MERDEEREKGASGPRSAILRLRERLYTSFTYSSIGNTVVAVSGKWSVFGFKLLVVRNCKGPWGLAGEVGFVCYAKLKCGVVGRVALGARLGRHGTEQAEVAGGPVEADDIRFLHASERPGPPAAAAGRARPFVRGTGSGDNGSVGSHAVDFEGDETTAHVLRGVQDEDRLGYAVDPGRRLHFFAGGKH